MPFKRTAFFSGLLALYIVLGLVAPLASAQDTKAGITSGGWDPGSQQIPGPGCLTTRGAWEGCTTPCAADEHETWLADVRRWRAERLIRIGYNGARYEMPELRWTQS